MTVDPARIATAQTVLAQLGVTVADLQRAQRPAVPTVADLRASGGAAAGPGAQRAYGTYWQRMAIGWGDRPLDAVAASDVETMQPQMAATARSRRNSRHGRHAGERVVAAARALFNRAIADGLVDAGASPAHRVAKPRRLPNTRRVLTPDELEEINRVARTSGNDVVLDALPLRLHTETACRRDGALGRNWPTSTSTAAWSGFARRARCSAGNPSPSSWPPRWPSTPTAAAPFFPPTRCCGSGTARR
jgi:hypothetical protein